MTNQINGPVMCPDLQVAVHPEQANTTPARAPICVTSRGSSTLRAGWTARELIRRSCVGMRLTGIARPIWSGSRWSCPPSSSRGAGTSASPSTPSEPSATSSSHVRGIDPRADANARPKPPVHRWPRAEVLGEPHCSRVPVVGVGQRVILERGKEDNSSDRVTSTAPLAAPGHPFFRVLGCGADVVLDDVGGSIEDHLVDLDWLVLVGVGGAVDDDDGCCRWELGEAGVSTW
jgi:hypothetical protein